MAKQKPQPHQELADRIRLALKESAVRQAELARACGVTDQAVHAWVTDGRISKRYLATLAGLTKKPLAFFLADLSGPHPPSALKRLYDERVSGEITQEEFGVRYGLGTQGMVWQYLNGHTPLNIEAAAKFAKGLNCKIDDFSPELAATLRDEVLPFLAKHDVKKRAETLAQRITARREEVGLSQKNLGDMAGVSKAAVSQWERGGTKNLKMEHLFAIADALKVNARWLATGQGPREP